MELVKTERFPGLSANVRIDYFKYKGVNLHEQTRIPHFWGKNVSNLVVLDLQYPMGTYDCLSDGFYCDENYGVPVFSELSEAKEFIDKVFG